MCFIYVVETPHRDVIDRLSQEWDSNRDGGGIAWTEGGAVHFQKGLMEKDRLLETVERIFDSKKPPFVVHLRAASAGGVDPRLTHPHVVQPVSLARKNPAVRGTARKVLFHNGHVSGWELLAKVVKSALRAKGPMSDTRAIALAMALAGDRVIEGVYGRFAVMTPNGVELRGTWYDTDYGKTSAPGYCAIQLRECPKCHVKMMSYFCHSCGEITKPFEGSGRKRKAGFSPQPEPLVERSSYSKLCSSCGVRLGSIWCAVCYLTYCSICIRSHTCILRGPT